MPIIVKELIVKASVQDGKAGSNNGSTQALPFNDEQRKQLISEAVEQALEQLQKIKDR